MYPLSISLIAFTIFLFEIISSIFFGRLLDSDVLILGGIMCAPILYKILQRDMHKWHTISETSIAPRVRKRRSLHLIFSLLSKYSILGILLSIFFLGLFTLIGNSTGIFWMFLVGLFFLGITVLASFVSYLIFSS